MGILSHSLSFVTLFFYYHYVIFVIGILSLFYFMGILFQLPSLSFVTLFFYYHYVIFVIGILSLFHFMDILYPFILWAFCLFYFMGILSLLLHGHFVLSAVI
ncbi:unnamed protein product [Meloidogyne enterolobii]|uniref:Uncharacterized protein n=1 Tax=Meloidogyne enterolobii TaxID=390850 RepID=A0ACB0XZJ8_MELEN